ncbi:MAG: LptE family protein [Rikenellaceae bacterium]
MNIRKISYLLMLAVAMLMGVSSCQIKYSLSGASISPLAKTVSVGYFPNNAMMVAPILSSTLTESLQDKFQRQTRLDLVTSGGDLNFEGEITGYATAPTAISGDEYATMNRLTITVKVRFTNLLEPNYNYDKTFTAFADYDTSNLLQDVESELITEIVGYLVDDIFSDAVSNW